MLYLADIEIATGRIFICFPPIKYSDVEFTPRHAKKTPIRADADKVNPNAR